MEVIARRKVEEKTARDELFNSNQIFQIKSMIVQHDFRMKKKPKFIVPIKIGF